MRTKWLQAWLTAVALSALGLAARAWGSLAYPPQELFGTVTQFLGVPAVFQLVHAIFGLGQGGKIFGFLGVILLWLGGVTVLGVLGPLVGGALLSVTLLLLVPWPVALAYGVAFALVRTVFEVALKPAAVGTDGTRRTVVGALWGGSVLVVAGGLTGLFRTVGSSAPAASAGSTGGELPGITPTQDFYYVSKNLEAFDPTVDGEKWRLEVDGLVKSPASLSLSDLERFSQRTVELTLSCISNPVGGPLIGNALWIGFPVSELLREVGVGGGAKFIVWRAADGYEESLPLGDAFEEDVLLVHRMNGERLSRKHGFPLRVLIPGRYGMKQPRWITGIRLSAEDVPGYWVKRGWSKTARVEITSRIDEPQELNPVVKAGAPSAIRGIAFGGLLPITKVEVSTDGGKNWQSARLTAPRSKHAWTAWELPWTPQAGSYQVVARAFSGNALQKENEKDALPEGATGWHRFIVTAS